MADVYHGSELMLHPSLDQTLLGVTQFRVVHDSDKNPIIFSLNDKGKFVVICQNATGESLKIDLSSKMGPASDDVVTTFAISQDATFLDTYLVFVSTPKTRSETRLHVLKPFKLSQVWSDTSEWLVETSSTDKTNPVITRLLLAPAIKGSSYPFLAAVVTFNGKHTKDVARVEVNTSTWHWSWAHDLTFPFNVEEMVDLCAGAIPTGSGIFAIDKSDGQPSLTFVGLSSNTIPRSPVTVTLPVVANARCLATTTDPLGFTNILVGGNGILHISAQKAINSVKQGLIVEPTIKSEHLMGLVNLQVAQEGDSVVLWSQNADRNLVHQRCRMDTSDYMKKGILHLSAMSESVPLLTGHPNLMKFDVVTDSRTKAQRLYLLKDDGSVTCMYQAGDSFLWNSQSVKIPDPESFEEVPTYMCQVRFRSKDGKPMTTTKVKLSSSSQCIASVNGHVLQLGQSKREIELNDEFSLAIMIAANDLDVPTLTISDFGDNQTYTLQPANKATDKLADILAKGNFDELKKPDGSPLIPATVGKDDMRKATDTILALRTSYQQMAGSSAAASASPLALQASAGVSWDWWHTIVNGFQEITHWVYEGGVFIVHTAKKGWGFVIDSCEKALKAIGQVFDWLGAKIEDLLVALASFLDWESILQTKAFLKEVSNLGIQDIKELVAAGGNKVDDFMKDIETKVGEWHFPPILPSDINKLNPRERKDDTKADEAKSSPLFSWGFNQTKGLNKKDGGVAEGSQKTLTGIAAILQNSWDDHIKPLGADIEGMMKTLWNDLEKVFDSGSNLSWQDSLKNVGSDLVLTLVKIVRRLIHLGFDVVITLFDWMQDLLNAPIKVPILSRVYKRLTGEDLSVLDLFSLLWAIPTTYMCKWLFGKKPIEFPEFKRLLEEIDYKPPNLKKDSVSVISNTAPRTVTAARHIFPIINSTVLPQDSAGDLSDTSFHMHTKNAIALPQVVQATLRPSSNSALAEHSKTDSSQPQLAQDTPGEIAQNSENWKTLRRWFRFGWMLKDAFVSSYTVYDTIATWREWPKVTKEADYDDFNELLGERPKWKVQQIVLVVVVCLCDFPSLEKPSSPLRVSFWLTTSVVNVWKAGMPGVAKVPLVGLASTINLVGYAIVLIFEGIADGKLADSILEVTHRLLTAAWGVGSAYNGITGAKEPIGLGIGITIGVFVDIQAAAMALGHLSYWKERGFSAQYEPPSWSTTLSGSYIG